MSEADTPAGYPLAGGCLCRQVRFAIARPPYSVAFCHCRLCQLAHGAPTVAWASVPRAGLEVTGEVRWHASSAKAERGFCPVCGSSLFFRFRAATLDIDVATACLDDPEALPPEYHTWDAARPRWLELADHLPRHPDDGPDGPVMG